MHKIQKSKFLPSLVNITDELRNDDELKKDILKKKQSWKKKKKKKNSNIAASKKVDKETKDLNVSGHCPRQ